LRSVSAKGEEKGMTKRILLENFRVLKARRSGKWLIALQSF